MNGTTVRWSVVELTGGEWTQGDTLASGEGTTKDLAEQIAAKLDAWLADCDTGTDGDTYPPALEINIEAVDR